MPKREVIEGLEVSTWKVGLEERPMVEIARRNPLKESIVELTPDQARNLAKQLEEAAGEAER